MSYWIVAPRMRVQEILQILLNLKVCYRVYNSPSQDLDKSYLNSVHALTPKCIRFILILFLHIPVGLSRCFPSAFTTRILYALFISPQCATCTTHLILFSFITQIIFVIIKFCSCSMIYVFRSRAYFHL